MAASESTPARLWVAVVGPAAAFAVHELGSVVLTMRLCSTGNGGQVRMALITLHIWMLAFAVIATGIGYSRWKARHGESRAYSAALSGGREMLALFAVLAGVAMTVGLLWAGLPPILLDVCEVRR